MRTHLQSSQRLETVQSWTSRKLTNHPNGNSKPRITHLPTSNNRGSNSPINHHNLIIHSQSEMMICLRLVGLAFKILRTRLSMAKLGVWSAVLSVGASLRRTESRSILRLVRKLNRNEKSLISNKWEHQLMQPVKVSSKILTLRSSRIDKHRSLQRWKRVNYQNGNFNRCSWEKWLATTSSSLLITKMWARRAAEWTMEVVSRWKKTTEWCVISVAESSMRMQLIATLSFARKKVKRAKWKQVVLIRKNPTTDADFSQLIYILIA